VFVAALLASLSLWRAWFDRVDLSIAVFVAWCALSVLWSPDRLASVDGVEKLLAVALCLMALRRLNTGWLVPAAVGGVIIATVMGSPFAGFGNPEFLVQFSLIALPMLSASVVGIACGLILAAAVVMTPSLIPFTLALGTPLLLPRWPAKAVCASVLGVVAVVVLMHSQEAWDGVGTRLDMFAGTIAAWLEHPVIGWGFGSFVYVFPAYQGAGEAFGLMPLSVEARTYANAAHNEFLQLLMETGVVGFALAGWCVWELFQGKHSWALWVVAILCLTGFPLQSPATAMLAALAAARAVPSPTRRGSLPLVAVAGALAMGVVALSIPAKVMAQAHFSAVSRYYDPTVIDQKAAPLAALNHANQAYELDPANPRLRLALFQTAALSYRRFPNPDSRAAVDAAYAISRTASPSDTLALVTRLQFLIARQECFTSRECDSIANELVRTASRKAEVRRLVSIYG